ncbi:unnamed protein product [Mycena citricolor]|uniref:BED-type domain-containing protein n=1 Tax=Mycena citricolor TaxID=2018698 RepID=A0AAD2H918_9AGAR|nr:unnamed protein product [Mycena citricolor]
MSHNARASPIWNYYHSNGKPVASCKVCRDGIERNGTQSELVRHEKTQTHTKALQRQADREQDNADFLRQAASSDPAVNPPITDRDIADHALRNLLSSLGGGTMAPHAVTQPNPTLADGSGPDLRSHTPLRSTASNIGISWNLMEAYGETELIPSADERSVQSITNAILERFDLEALSDEDENERSDAESELAAEDPVLGNADSNRREHVPKHARGDLEPGSEAERLHWYPWDNRITCTLDVLMHLPRSVFSQRQLDLFLWLLKVNNVPDVPSIKQMQQLDLALQKLCGIETIAYNGALGHKYHVNSLAQIIAQASLRCLSEIRFGLSSFQEMANPRVRPHLSFYPEDSGNELSEARQGQRWLHELPNDQTTPMIRLAGKDYYIYEPCMATSERDGVQQYVIPVQFFTRGGSLFAKCWRMHPVVTDQISGWRVDKTTPFEVDTKLFFKTFTQFQSDVEWYQIPNPSHIIDVVDLNAMTQSTPWTYTNPVIGNPWRSKAGGCRVVSFPMWLYCDDTHESQKEYNIHFLCTSNIAPPLEMLDGIVEQLKNGQDVGIWTWDIELEEPVLVVPEVLALLGDNPMQSKFACHIGLRGKFFCRACWARGHTAKSAEPSFGAAGATDSAGPSGDQSDVETDDDDINGVGGESDDSAASAGPKKGKQGKKALETMGQMVNRIKAFMTLGRLRNKAETVNYLRSEFLTASTAVDKKTQIKNLRTETGIKDTFQQFFVEKLFDSYKNKRGHEARIAALEAQVRQMPMDMNAMSPVWRIRGLDAHQDTPVEILHVVLLGFVKYLWRDLIQLQLKNKDDKKKLLITRLNSVDTSGLGISPLAGRTLVQYAGSLTGRDFRVIAQVAPFVVFDLVDSGCFDTWKALSKLIPLIWQPRISDINAYTNLLTSEINHFLICAARWTNRWFNKPKFHILLHLPAHIRRFGPAILFATEAFESFNAIIRAKSVHSNRHAPSRDIAVGFAQGNRVRHLLSGGCIRSESAADCTDPRNWQKRHWMRAGEGALTVVEGNTVASYLGLQQDRITNVMGGSYVLVKKNTRATEIYHIEEVLQKKGSVNALAELPDVILMRQALVNPSQEKYGMPRVWLSNCWVLGSLEEILCTVNVQHNCIDHHCDTSAEVPIYQERTKTMQTQARIKHRGDLDNVVLNTAQMRDACHLQQFRINAPIMQDLDQVVHESAVKEIALRKHSKTKTKPSTPTPVPRSGASADPANRSPLTIRIPSLRQPSSLRESSGPQI